MTVELVQFQIYKKLRRSYLLKYWQYCINISDVIFRNIIILHLVHVTSPFLWYHDISNNHTMLWPQLSHFGTFGTPLPTFETTLFGLGSLMRVQCPKCVYGPLLFIKSVLKWCVHLSRSLFLCWLTSSSFVASLSLSDGLSVDGLIFMGYQFSWFLWRVISTNSSANEIAIFCMSYEGKYYGHEFWTPRMRDICSIHENLCQRK